MIIKIPNEIWNDKRLSFVDKLIYAKISADTIEYGELKATYGEISASVNCSYSSVAHSLPMLLEYGYISYYTDQHGERVYRATMTITPTQHKI